MRTIGLLAAALSLAFLRTAAAATEPEELCGPFVQLQIAVAPLIDTNPGASATDHAFGCLMWQSFIYLNWPALADAPGEPDPAARLGGPGAAVWETYKRHDEVFRKHGAPPSPWGAPEGVRRLSTIHQTGGGILVDRAGKPVYYEICLNRDEFNYIVANKLYDAEAQLALARRDGIVLPAGPTRDYGPIGAIEIKAAWKVLTPAELAERPRRFHTAEAVLDDGTLATVGLVGMHVNQRVTGFTEGVWASFLQIDSAPLAGAPDPARRYSFYDDACADCAVNTSTAPPRSTQVEQVFPVAPSVRAINDHAHALIHAEDPRLALAVLCAARRAMAAIRAGPTDPSARSAPPLAAGRPALRRHALDADADEPGARDLPPNAQCELPRLPRQCPDRAPRRHRAARGGLQLPLRACGDRAVTPLQQRFASYATGSASNRTTIPSSARPGAA